MATSLAVGYTEAMGEPVLPLPDLDDDSVPDDHELSPAWQEEIRRRLADFDAGRTKGIPWEDVRRELFARFKK